MRNKLFLLKYIGKVPIVQVLAICYLPALVLFAYIVLYEHTSFPWKITDCVVFGILYLWFLLAIFIHPIIIKNNHTINIVHFSYPFREKIKIESINRISSHKVSTFLGIINYLTLYTRKKQVNIFITDTEGFCEECLRINPNIKRTQDL